MTIQVKEIQKPYVPSFEAVGFEEGNKAQKERQIAQIIDAFNEMEDPCLRKV